MKEKIVIIGVNQTAVNLLEFILYHDLFDVVAFSVNKQYMNDDKLMGLPIYAIEDLEQHINKTEIKLFVAVLWNKLNSLRRKLYEDLKAQGYSFANIISPTAILLSKELGDNCWIRDFVVVRPEATIGDNCIIEDYAHIGTGCNIESHSFCGTRSLVAGGCIVGEQSFLGISSTLLEAVEIGKKCIVGAGCVVKRNLACNSVIKVAADSYIIKQYSESEIESKLDISKRVR